MSKYIGPREDRKIKLNKLHSTEWQRTKQRVYSSVKDMADELIKLYAERAAAKGFAFSEDSEWQREFEERFEYTETDDQLRCIEEILSLIHIYNMEYQVKNRGGEYVWVVCRGLLNRDEAGRPVTFAGVVAPIANKGKICLLYTSRCV